MSARSAVLGSLLASPMSDWEVMLTEAIELLRACGDENTLAAACYSLSRHRLMLKRIDEAIDGVDEAIDLASRTGQHFDLDRLTDSESSGNTARSETDASHGLDLDLDLDAAALRALALGGVLGPAVFVGAWTTGALVTNAPGGSSQRLNRAGRP